MSSIKIVCRNNCGYTKSNQKTDSKTGNELIIESNRLFMNTEQFFKNVAITLKDYFDKIEKK